MFKLCIWVQCRPLLKFPAWDSLWLAHRCLNCRIGQLGVSHRGCDTSHHVFCRGWLIRKKNTLYFALQFLLKPVTSGFRNSSRGSFSKRSSQMQKNPLYPSMKGSCGWFKLGCLSKTGEERCLIGRLMCHSFCMRFLCHWRSRCVTQSNKHDTFIFSQRCRLSVK